MSDFQKKPLGERTTKGHQSHKQFGLRHGIPSDCPEKNSTVMGTGVVQGHKSKNDIGRGNHLPISLVFTQKKTLPSIKEFLFALGTLAVYYDFVVAREAALIQKVLP